MYHRKLGKFGKAVGYGLTPDGIWLTWNEFKMPRRGTMYLTRREHSNEQAARNDVAKRIRQYRAGHAR